MIKPKVLPVMILVISLLLSLVGSALASETTGTWTLYPQQGTSYTTAIQRPIKPVGFRGFRNYGKSVIPLKFSLLAAPGPVVFESIGSDDDDANDYSYLSFIPDQTFTFKDLTNLQADYMFTLGNCWGGALRWEVRVDENGNGVRDAEDGAVFIYYGDLPNFTDCTTTNQSGVNMIGLTDLRYDLTQVGGTFYDTYIHAQELVGNMAVLSASLVLDGGWRGDQRVTLTGATVNDNTFVPLSGPPTQTCDLPPATILVTKLTEPSSGTVSEPKSIQPNDDDSSFRVVDCKYMYNLATNSLPGPGRYMVEVVIDGNPVPGAALFDVMNRYSNKLNIAIP